MECWHGVIQQSLAQAAQSSAPPVTRTGGLGTATLSPSLALPFAPPFHAHPSSTHSLFPWPRCATLVGPREWTKISEVMCARSTGSASPRKGKSGRLNLYELSDRLQNCWECRHRVPLATTRRSDFDLPPIVPAQSTMYSSLSDSRQLGADLSFHWRCRNTSWRCGVKISRLWLIILPRQALLTCILHW